MPVLTRYILRAIVVGTALALFALMAIISFFNLIGQLDDVGSGTYELADAMTYVALNIPRQAFEVFPIAALLGALLGLGNLATHSELIVMRASGVSRWRLAGAVMLAGIVLAAVTGALGEYIGPPMEQYARSTRALQKSGDAAGATLHSTWAKDGNLIINFSQLGSRGRIGGVHVFRFNDDRRLVSVGRASSAGFDRRQNWQLVNYRQTHFDGPGVTASSQRRHTQASGLNPDLLGLSVVDPQILAIAGLHSYVRYLRENGLDFARYEVAFWSRIAGTVSVVFMTLLALPAVLGPLRSAGAGARLLTGLLVGAAYFLANRTLANSGEVFGLEPVLIAWAPSVLICLGAAYGILRAR